MHVELQAASSTTEEYSSIFLTSKVHFFVRSLILEVTETK